MPLQPLMMKPINVTPQSPDNADTAPPPVLGPNLLNKYVTECCISSKY